MAYTPKKAGPRDLREMFHYLWGELKRVGEAIGDPSGGVIQPPDGGHTHDHATLVNILPDQHHNQVHEFFGPDHSNIPSTFPPEPHGHTSGFDGGLVDHAVLVGVDPDQHHPRDHLLYGTTHSDVFVAAAPTIRQGLFYSSADVFQLEYRDNWRGEYALGEYYHTRDIVQQDGWEMVSLVDYNIDEPAPQLSGTSEWVTDMTGVLAFVPATAEGTFYVTGNRYTWPVGGFVNGLRWYCSDASGNFEYELWIYTPARGVRQLFTALVPPAVGWQNFPITGLFPPGDTLEVALVVRGTVKANTFSGNWQTVNKNGNPIPGEASFQNSGTAIYFNHIDADSTDRRASLESVAIGAALRFNNTEWMVASTSHQIDHVRFGIQPSQGVPAEGLYSVEWEWGDVLPNPYERHTDYYASYAGITGFQGTEYPPLSYNQNAYGVDLNLETFNVSPNWEIKRTPPGSGGTGGGDGGGLVPHTLGAHSDTDFELMVHGEVPRWDNALGKWVNSPPPVSPVGGVALNMRYNAQTVVADPGAGFVSVNNADPALVTVMCGSRYTEPGADAGFIWLNRVAGSYIGAWELGSNQETVYYELTGPPIDHTTWYEVPVTLVTNTGNPDNNQRVQVFFIENPEQSIPPGGDTGEALLKQTPADYDTAWGPIVVDHGATLNRENDDHPQYHTDARGDARYVSLTGDTMTGTLVASSSGSEDVRLRVRRAATSTGLMYLDMSIDSAGVTNLRSYDDGVINGQIYFNGSAAYFCPISSTPRAVLTDTSFRPNLDNLVDLGTSSVQWRDIYTYDLHASGAVTVDSYLHANNNLTFESNKHSINVNDGSGNFNLKVGHTFGTGSICTEAGYGLWMVFNQVSGVLQFKISTASTAIGQPYTWQDVLTLDAASGDYSDSREQIYFDATGIPANSSGTLKGGAKFSNHTDFEIMVKDQFGAFTVFRVSELVMSSREYFSVNWPSGGSTNGALVMASTSDTAFSVIDNNTAAMGNVVEIWGIGWHTVSPYARRYFDTAIGQEIPKDDYDPENPNHYALAPSNPAFNPAYEGWELTYDETGAPNGAIPPEPAPLTLLQALAAAGVTSQKAKMALYESQMGQSQPLIQLSNTITPIASQYGTTVTEIMGTLL